MKSKSRFLSLFIASIAAGLLVAGIVFAWTNPSNNSPFKLILGDSESNDRLLFEK